MISKEDFKKALGEKIHSISEEDIEKLRIGMDEMAEILFDIWNDKIIKLDEGKTISTTKNM
ncbi:MAG: hypothetical protein WC827_01740 [Candidatus Paceibacterota bacterium]|jgi:hypothetical protein